MHIKIGSGHIRLHHGHLHKHTTTTHLEGGRIHKSHVNNHHISDSNIENLRESLKKLKVKTVGQKKNKYISF